MADTAGTSTGAASTSNTSQTRPIGNGPRRQYNNRNKKPNHERTNEEKSNVPNSTNNQENNDSAPKRGNYRGRVKRGPSHQASKSNSIVPSESLPSQTFQFNPNAESFTPNACCMPPMPNPQQRRQVTNPQQPNSSKSNRGSRGRGSNDISSRGRNGFPSNRGLPRNNNGSRGNSSAAPQRVGRRQVTRESLEPEPESLANQPLKERLIYQLENNRYECAICYQMITTKQGVWSCKTCYHVFHISKCIIDWAKSSRDKEDDNKWRCPTCQTKNDVIPYNYFCFCGKQKNPVYQLGETPHSCGDVCGRSRKFDCPHPCTDYCHPGPCSDCQLQTTRSCNCGKVRKSVRCGSGQPVLCDSVCEKPLSCENHKCQLVCHQGECGDCTVQVEQECYCGNNTRETNCSSSAHEKYSCGMECQHMFDCGIHKCNRKCHSRDGSCGECDSGTNRIKFCPCGKKSIASLGVSRNTCTDPIPTCESICDMVLECGAPGKRHRCQMKCHNGPCPPCQLNTAVQCRCGGSKRVIPCEEYMEIMRTTGEYLCIKRCKKRKSCGLHKCQEVCCIQDEHFCMQMCNKKLSCGLHTCENICHAGQCQRCLQSSFDEQFCYCGKTVQMPPIACGAPPPPCREKCTRTHSCNHPVNHNCHGEGTCPPCTYLTEKKCCGGHQIRTNIPCHITSVSCGIQCGKPLKCGKHLCTRGCHGEECEKEGEPCRNKCENYRAGCEHPCNLPCHGDEPCEPTPCRSLVKVTCECGRIKKDQQCWEVEKMLNAKHEKQEEEDVNTEDETLCSYPLKKSSSLTQLNCFKCDEECKKLERNRKLAEVLGIDIDEYGETKLAPTITFPYYLKAMVKPNLDFVKTVEKVFVGLYNQLSDPTREQNVVRAHLPPMNMEKRRFIHEYSNYFNIETESVDQPPKRSIMLTAVRGKCHLPLVVISDLINYKGALNTPGPSIIRKDLMDEIKKSTEPEETGMKTLKCTERVVYKRESRPPKQLTAAVPIKQSNGFALLGSDNDSDDEQEEAKGVTASTVQNSSSPKDWWDESTQNDGEWKEVKAKEYVVEVERDLTEEEMKELEAGMEGTSINQGTWDQAENDEEEESVKEETTEDVDSNQ